MLLIEDNIYNKRKQKKKMFESLQSKVILGLAVPVVILTQRQSFDMVKMLTQILLYLALAYNAECLVTGRCKIWAWLSILFPLIQTIGFLFFTNTLELDAPIRLPIPRINRQDTQRSEEHTTEEQPK